MDGYDVNPDSIYDIQVKRLHEYKRQLLNAFSIMTIYFRLKDKKLKNWTPTTFIFLKDSSWQKADNYFLIYDLPDYVDTKIRANTEYANRKEFGKKCLINIANAGKFSSDRTILQYAKEIWHTSYKK